MRIPEDSDLRVKRTITAIREAFRELVLSAPYENITVSGLCKHARINRKTFYRYYSDLDDLLTEIKEDLVAQYLERVDGTRIPEDLPAVAREFFLFSKEKGPAYDRIICSGSPDPIRHEFVNTVMKERWRQAPAMTRYSDEEQSVIIAFAINTGVEMYRQWLTLGQKIPATRMIDLYQRLLTGGIGAVL